MGEGEDLEGGVFVQEGVEAVAVGEAGDFGVDVDDEEDAVFVRPLDGDIEVGGPVEEPEAELADAGELLEGTDVDGEEKLGELVFELLEEVADGIAFALAEDAGGVGEFVDADVVGAEEGIGLGHGEAAVWAGGGRAMHGLDTAGALHGRVFNKAGILGKAYVCGIFKSEGSRGILPVNVWAFVFCSL